MSKQNKYDNKTACFVFTKSQTAGFYTMRNPKCIYLSYVDGSPEEIAAFFGKILIETLNGMEINQANKITLRCKWE